MVDVYFLEICSKNMRVIWIKDMVIEVKLVKVFDLLGFFYRV